MRIVFVAFNFKPNETDPLKWLKRIEFFSGIPEALAPVAEVYNIDFINAHQSLKQNGVEYIFPKRGINTVITAASLVKQIEAEIVFVQGLNFPLHSILLKLFEGKKVKIIACHHAEKPGSFLYRLLQKVANQHISAYLFSTVQMAKPWVERRMVDKKKLYSVAEASSVYFPIDKNIAKDHIGINGDPIFLWVGRLNANKDPFTVIEAFSKYVVDHPSAQAYMIFSADDLLGDVKDLILKKNVANNIHLVGHVPRQDMLYWFNAADFIICSSFYEGCNISVIEAMSCGCIPIVTDIASFELHTDNGRIGCLFTPGSADELLNAFITGDSMDIPVESAKVLAYYEAHLSFAAIGKKMYQVIEEVLS
jgi:glycosyltransferase involved in cell wall biosynthesis